MIRANRKLDGPFAPNDSRILEAPRCTQNVQPLSRKTLSCKMNTEEQGRNSTNQPSFCQTIRAKQLRETRRFVPAEQGPSQSWTIWCRGARDLMAGFWQTRLLTDLAQKNHSGEFPAKSSNNITAGVPQHIPPMHLCRITKVIVRR